MYFAHHLYLLTTVRFVWRIRVRLRLLFIARCSIQLSAITDHLLTTPIFLYLFLLIIMVCVVIGHLTD